MRSSSGLHSTAPTGSYILGLRIGKNLSILLLPRTFDWNTTTILAQMKFNYRNMCKETTETLTLKIFNCHINIQYKISHVTKQVDERPDRIGGPCVALPRPLRKRVCLRPQNSIIETVHHIVHQHHIRRPRPSVYTSTTTELLHLDHEHAAFR